MWCPCLLHLDELILKEMIKVYDGPTNGPNSWSGDTGQRIEKLAKDPENCLKKGISVKPIESLHPDTILEDLMLNNDQQYLHLIINYIKKGGCLPDDFAEKLLTPAKVIQYVADHEDIYE